MVYLLDGDDDYDTFEIRAESELIQRTQKAERKQKDGKVNQHLSWYDDMVPKEWLIDVYERDSCIALLYR